MAVRREAGLTEGIVLSLVTFLPIMATVSLAPCIPLFHEHFAAVPGAQALVPMLVTLPAVFIAILSPIAGALSDRFGRRRLLLGALILYGLCGLAPLLLDDLRAILASRVGVGAAEGMLMTVGKSLIGDYYDGPRRQQWVGVQGIIDACLGSLTWFLGGALAQGGWRAPFLLYLISIPLFLAVAWKVWEPVGVALARSVRGRARTAFPWRTGAVIAIVTLFTSLMYFAYPVNIAGALRELGLASSGQIGAYTAIASIGTPLGALAFTRAARLPGPLLIGIALAFVGAGCLGIGMSTNPLTATVFGFIEQIGNGVAGAALVTWALYCLPVEHRGRGMGVWSTCLVAGIFLSPLVFTILSAPVGGIRPGFALFGLASLVGALVIGRLPLLRRLGAAV